MLCVSEGCKTLPGYRVVGFPEKNKIGWKALVCGDSYYGEAQLLRRNRSSLNKKFEKLKLYERIEMSHHSKMAE